jgi:hypothetical protein
MVVLVTMKKSIEKDTTSVEKKELKLESQWSVNG